MRRLIYASCVALIASTVIAQDPPAVAKVGEPAPDISLTDVDGRKFRLSDVTGSGKNVALMFSRAHW